MAGLKDRLQHALEDLAYYCWIGATVALGALAFVRFLLQPLAPYGHYGSTLTSRP